MKRNLFDILNDSNGHALCVRNAIDSTCGYSQSDSTFFSYGLLVGHFFESFFDFLGRLMQENPSFYISKKRYFSRMSIEGRKRNLRDKLELAETVVYLW